MKTRLRTTLASLALLAGAIAGCSTESYQIAAIPITDFTVPAEILPNTPLDIVVTYGVSSCVSFERFDTGRSSNRFVMLAMGRAPFNSTCTGEVRTETQTLRLSPPFDDPFTVVALEPDGTTIEKVVRVRTPVPVTSQLTR